MMGAGHGAGDIFPGLTRHAIWSRDMKTAIPAGLCALVLAACQPQVPDSGATGVGFGDYGRYQAEQARLAQERAARERQLAVTTVAPPTETGAPTAAEIAAAGIGAPANPTNQSVGAPLNAAGLTPAADATGTGAVIAANNPEISDEQDFAAVSGRETIEGNAERLARLRAQRVEIAPSAVPKRPSSTGPNIVAYALSTTNQPGQSLYRRGLASQSRAVRACARFSSPDLAQQAFLEGGGPERDRRGLDPDGDGFACEWDPRPYRLGASQPNVPDQVAPEG